MVKRNVPSASRDVWEVASVCSHAHELLEAMPLGKRTVPVTLPAGTWLFSGNISHMRFVTSLCRVPMSWNVMLTSNLRLLCLTVAGMFQPISMFFCSPEPFGSMPSVVGSNGCGESEPAVVSAMYQCPA